MELRHLRYFVAVADAENVSRAALKLHVSQPALSRQIRDLEEELGFPLLERSAKSVRLTPAGRVFHSEAKAVLDRAQEAISAARVVAVGGGELHVGYAMSPTVRILPPALRAFQAELPNVRVKLHDLSTEEMLAGLREGKLQIAVLARSNPSRLRGLRAEELTRVALCMALSPNHPLAHKRQVTLADLAPYPLVAFSRTEYPDYYDLLESLYGTIQAKPPVSEEHDSVASLIAAVEAGTGVALVTESLACVAGPRLKLVKLLPAPPPLAIIAAWPESGLTSAAAAFLDCARQAAH
jgi:DNA-binding transcriptional LysR family regulator